MAFVDGDYDDDDEVDGATVTTLTTTTMMLEGRKVDNKEVTANSEWLFSLLRERLSPSADYRD